MIARLVAASIFGGVLLGAAGRLAMRFVALEAGLAGGFSVGGSLEVVTYGALVGTPVALAFLILRPRIPIASPWAGAMLGLLLFFVLSILRLPSAQSALAATSDVPAFTLLAFGSHFVLWGAILDLVGQRILRRHPPRQAG